MARILTFACLGGALLAGLGVLFGALAGFGRRHPFDHLWNAVVRHLVDAPPLPPSPTRRRHAFKFATAHELTETLEREGILQAR